MFSTFCFFLAQVNILTETVRPKLLLNYSIVEEGERVSVNLICHSSLRHKNTSLLLKRKKCWAHINTGVKLLAGFLITDLSR